MPAIELQQITKRYFKEDSLSGIDLKVNSEEYFTILGNTGGGKTTLLHIIAGLTRPDEGRVLFDGKNVTKQPPYERNLGLVFENYALFPHMTLGENIGYSRRVKGKDPEETARISREIQHMLQLIDREGARVPELSGGMQQRVALGRALMNMEGSGTLLLDEPFKALDAGLRMSLRVEIRKMAKDPNMRLTTVHVTNDVTEAMMVSDRIALVRDGKIVQVGTPKELYFHPNCLYSAYFMSDTVYFRGNVKSVLNNVSEIQVDGKTFQVKGAGEEFQPGDAVVVIIRNDYFSMGVDSTSLKWRKNHFRGTINSVKFMGPFTHFTLHLWNGKEIAIDLPSTFDIGEKFEEGQEVWLSFKPKKAFLFPDPGESINELYFEI